MASGTATNAEGRLDLSVDVEVRDPAGKSLMERREFAVQTGKAPAKPAWVMLSNALDFLLEDSDPNGRYSVIANLHDRVSGKTATRLYTIDLKKPESGSK